MTENEQTEAVMQNVRRNARQILRVALVLASAQTVVSAYDAMHAMSQYVMAADSLFDVVDEKLLGFSGSMRRMVPVETTLQIGENLLAYFRVPEPSLSGGVGAIIKTVACEHCGAFLTVEGACPNQAQTDAANRALLDLGTLGE